MDVLAKEVTQLYRAHRAGESPQLAALPVQYADYVLWQRRRVQGELLQKQLAYWKEQLNGAPTIRARQHPAACDAITLRDLVDDIEGQVVEQRAIQRG